MWASIEHTAQRVIDDAFDEALRRDPDLRRRWVVLVDGQLDQRRRIERAAAKRGVSITIVLDIVHVLEYLWRAAHAFHPGAHAAAEQWVECRLRALRTSGDLDAYGAFHLAKEYERTHPSRYADAAVPIPLAPGRPHLRLVK